MAPLLVCIRPPSPNQSIFAIAHVGPYYIPHQLYPTQCKTVVNTASSYCNRDWKSGLNLPRSRPLPWLSSRSWDFVGRVLCLWRARGSCCRMAGVQSQVSWPLVRITPRERWLPLDAVIVYVRVHALLNSLPFPRRPTSLTMHPECGRTRGGGGPRRVNPRPNITRLGGPRPDSRTPSRGSFVLSLLSPVTPPDMHAVPTCPGHAIPPSQPILDEPSCPLPLS